MITIRIEKSTEERFRIEMPETGYSYEGTVVQAEISGPSGPQAKAYPGGFVSFILSGRDVIVK